MMMVLPCLAVGFFMNLIAVLFVLTCVALILIVLIQKGKGGGLSAAFGGGMGGGVLGSKTGDFLTWVTICLTAVFLFLAVIMAKFYKPTTGDFGPSSSQVTAEEDSDANNMMLPEIPVGDDNDV